MSTDRSQEAERLRADIESALSGAGIQILEFGLSRQRGTVKVKTVIYSPTGTGTDECTKAYRLMLPRIQIALGAQDPEIEISSPGIDRILKSESEWTIFAGKAVRVLMKGEELWRSGRLEAPSGGKASIVGKDGRFGFELSAVAKARLDSNQEGE